MEAESRGGYQGWGAGGNGGIQIKGTRLWLCRMVNSRDLMYSMVTMINNTVLNAGDVLREQISGAAITIDKYVR